MGGMGTFLDMMGSFSTAFPQLGTDHGTRRSAVQVLEIVEGSFWGGCPGGKFK
jgi:hypothetical protein